MRKQLFLVTMLVALCFGSAFAAKTPPQVFDVNVISPVTGGTYYPNLNGSDKCIDFNFQVFDSNIGSPIHRANIYYDLNLHGTDGNVSMATDVNLDGTNCKFHGAATTTNFTTGADCHIKYCFSKQVNGTFTVDVNVADYGTLSGRDLNANQVLTITINNRYIDSSAESMINLVPIVIVAAIIIVAVLGIGGVLPGVLVITLLPALVIALIAILIFGGILNSLLGK